MQLRRRLVCYYCGQRSGVSRTGTQKFRCDKCLAVNFLDEGGDITDVPPEEVGTNDVGEHDNLDNLFVPPEDSIFCSTCLKNQYFYTRALSQYLPEPEDPRYAECEANLSAFQRRLDETYPQCCAVCEPKVKSQLQHATNVARSDHLRRVLDRSRQRRVAHVFGWRRLLVSAAGFGYFASVATQLSWHLMAAMTGSTGEVSIPGLTGWLPLTIRQETLGQNVGYSLALGLLCIWWNPKWQHKLQAREGRLVGLDSYYKSQVGILVLRAVLSTIIADVDALAGARPAMHCLSAVLITLLSLMSVFGIVKVDTTPLVDWHQDPTALLSVNQFVPPTQSFQPTPGNSQGSASQTTAFNVHDLGTATPPTYTPWRSPTPPEDGDTMDWAPAQGFQPQPKSQRFHPNKTPFYGTLPIVPRSGLREPNQSSHEPPKAIGIPPGFFDKSRKLQTLQERTSLPAMAEPKFFANNIDTGLEKMFGRVFSLDDDMLSKTMTPAKPQQASQPKSSKLTTTYDTLPVENRSFSTTMLAGTMAVVLTVGLAIWSFNSSFSTIDYKIDLFLLYFSCIVSALQLLECGLNKDASQHHGRLVWLGLQTIALVPSILYRASSNTPVALIWTKTIAGSLSLVLIHSLYIVLQGSHPPQALPPLRAQESKTTQYILPPSHPLSLEVDMEDSPGPTIFSRTRRDSNDSVDTTTSGITTSTAPGWKTPKAERSAFDYQAHSSDRTRLEFGRLGLNDRGLSSGFGSSIAGSRNRRGYGNPSQAW